MTSVRDSMDKQEPEEGGEPKDSVDVVDDAAGSGEAGDGGSSEGVEPAEGESSMPNGMEIEETKESSQAPPPETNPPAVDEDKPSEAEIKYWSAVKETPSDFSSWTCLLQLVEQKGKLDPVREVFDAFLGLYPYCYGYWKKYADLERKHSGNDTARKVFERGVEAIPLSVDLWIHYLGFIKAVQGEGTEGTETIRSMYCRAVEACGMDYRSSKLWDSYLEWEKANGSPQHLMRIYDTLLATPTQQYQHYFESFKQLVEATPPSDLLSAEEKEELWRAVASADQEEAAVEKAVREKILERRSTVHERCKTEVEKRSRFEDGIKRPYFHVKPLERAQLRNWREYLDFEIAEGNQQRILILFERCMVACALYEDFWIKFAKYAEDNCPDMAPSVYTRACTVHLQQKPNIHILWAAYEEKRGNVDKARGILKGIDSLVPGLVLVRLRRIGLEVREQRYEEAEALYRESTTSAEDTETRNFYAWRYARFAAKVLGDSEKAVKVMREAIDQDTLNPTLYLRLLDVAASGCPPNETEVEAVFAMVQHSDLPEEVKQSFALRRAQFLEEFGSSITKLLEAQEECQQLRKTIAGTRKRAASEADSEPPKKAKTTEPNAVTPSLPQDQQPQAQQWAAYQQQWGGYNYGQQGYTGYQQPYYQYPYGPQTQ